VTRPEETARQAPEGTAVVIADVGALPWRALPPAGLHAKTLSVDPETGARTALLRMAPQEGYVPPATAHYHDTYEEILGVSGRFTFDAKVWLERGGYIYHPAGTVHGFTSLVPEDSILLSRVGPGHMGNAVTEPAQPDMYSVYETADPRAPVAASDPAAGIAPEPRAFLGDQIVQWREIAAAPMRAHGAAMVVLPAGWRTTAAVADQTVEIFTLTPGLVLDGVTVPESSGGSFVRIPIGAAVPSMACTTDVHAFVTFGDI